MSTTQNARKKLTMAVAQENLYSHNVARAVAKVDTTTMGTIYNPYTSQPAISSAAVSSESYNTRSYSAEADTLQVNHRIDLSEHVNSYDWKSVGFGLIQDRAKNFGMALANEIDRKVFTNVVGNGGFALGDGGASGSTTPWQITSSTADDMVSTAIEQIDIAEGHGQKKFMVVSPYEMSALRNFLMGTGNNVADDAITKGTNFRGTTVNGVDIYQTNNLRNSVVLALATAVTADDTVTINGITFTFVASIGTDAGNVLRSATAGTNATNLAGLINAPRTTNANQVALSEEDAAKVERLGLSAEVSGTNVTITANATLVVSETLTDGSDGFGNVSRQCIAGAYDSLFLALPTAGMDYHEKEVSGKAGVELYMEQFMQTTIWTKKKPLVGTILTRD